MLTRLVTHLEDRAAAWLERVLRNSIRLELAPLERHLSDAELHLTELRRGQLDLDRRVTLVVQPQFQTPTPEPATPAMVTVTFADLTQEDTAPAPASEPPPTSAPAPIAVLPNLTPRQRADLKWAEHPLGLVPVNWLADRLGIPAEWVWSAAEERGIEQLHFANGLRYGHAWRHWLDLWGPAKVREWLDTHGNAMDIRRYEEALKRGDR